MTKTTTKNKLSKIGVAYIRESTEEQDKGFSPKVQEKGIRDYADKNNIKIVEFYKDLISGTEAKKRDDFQRMISDAKQHKFEIILVYHTSRFARNIRQAREYKDLLRKELNIDVVSVTQYFGNWQEPSASFNEGISELVDENISRQISFWVRTGLMEKRQQGYQTGNPPFGYYKKQVGYDKEKDRKIYLKQWLVEPREAKIILKLYKLYATGKYSFNGLVKELRNEKIKTKYGNPFTYSTMKDILGNKVYLGYVTSPRKKDLPDIKGKHPIIVPKPLFDKVQNIIKERRWSIGRPVAQHRFYLLQGLVYCYNCIKYLKGKENNPNAKLLPKMYCLTHWWKDKNGKRIEKYSYTCKVSRETQKNCGQPSVKCDIIDKQVITYMESFTLPDYTIKNTLAKLERMLNNVVHSKSDKQVIQTLKDKKRKLNFKFDNTDEISDPDYLKQLEEINIKLESLAQLGLMDKKQGYTKKEIMAKAEKFLKEFPKLWKSNIGDAERRAWIQMTIKRIWVKNNKVVAIEPKDDFKPLFSSQKKVIGQAPLATLLRLTS